MRKLLFLLLSTCTLITYSQEKQISLNDIWASGTFYPKMISGFVNMNDGKSYCIQETDKDGYSVINQYDYTTGKLVKELFTAKGVVAGEQKLKTFDSYQFNDDQTILLIYFNSVQIYRHSSAGNYLVIDNFANRIMQGATGPKQLVMYPTLNPAGTKVAYVKGNNLYSVDLLTNKRKRITKDGETNRIINGAVDWVYEEEFGMSKGFEWNADGTKIAYYKFDESAVKEWVMPIYGDLYPEQYKFKYPKAGEANSIVEVCIADAKSGKSKMIDLGSENDQYIPRIKWTNNPEILSVQRLNRLQNKWELLMVQGTRVSTSLEEKNKYYVEVNDDLYFLDDNKHMIVTSEQDGNKHIYFHKLNGPQIYQVTSGKWDVDEILGVDNKNELLYYTSTEVSSVERHIYSIGFDGKNKKRLSTESGWHSAQFSNDYSLALHNYSSMTKPFVYTIRNKAWENVRVVEDNEAFVNRNKQFVTSDIEFKTMELSTGAEVNYYIIKPDSIDSSKKYPMLMHVYGGPGSQMVKNSYGWSNFYWHQMLANKHGVVISCVDNRGTGGKGEEFKKMTYKQLGKYETEDQIAAAQKLPELYPFIDSERIGIWGWSYGGYMSSLCLAKGNEVFKMAIAIAPVSNWRFYDNIYTERYMQTPQQNADGYDQNSPINFVKDIKGDYLIVHGTGDDNVHLQNAVMMIDEMIKHNIEFDSEFYPNKNHGIYGGFTRYHLYNRMTNFVIEKL